MNYNPKNPLILVIVFLVVVAAYLPAQTTFNISNNITGDTLLTIDNEGKVGVGTTHPVDRFEIAGRNPDEGGVLKLRNSDNSYYFTLFGGRQNDPNPLFLWQQGTPLRFSTYGAVYNEWMRISSEGYLGIGTTSPTEMLEVADTIYSSIGGFKFPDGTVQETAAGEGSGNGNTLDQAYDQGGAGAGRTITADAGAVTIAGVDGMLASGTINSGTIPATGAGTRLMWFPRRAAFRAGTVSGAQWDETNTGSYSSALGYSTVAGGSYSTALGFYANATGLTSFAFGSHATASGDYSFALGQGIEASGKNNVAIALSNQTGVNISQDSTMAIMGGKVGIGVASPTTMLQVADTIYSSVGGFQFPDGTVQETAANGGASQWQQNGSDIYYSNGNVGIGTTTPDFQFEITGKFGIRDSQMVYLPDQTDFEGTVYFGNGGNVLTNYGASYPRFNTVVGLNALYNNLIGARNTAVGYNALFTNEGYINNDGEGDDNTAIGYRALFANYGARNTAIGSEALRENKMGNDNTAIGYQTLQSLGGSPGSIYSGNTSVGSQIMTTMENGEGNTVIGYKNFWQGDNYIDNTIIGSEAARDFTLGGNNVIIGQSAAYSWTAGETNTIIGSKAGYFLGDRGSSGNVIIGYSAGASFIPPADHWNDNLIIANNQSTPLIYGEFDTRRIDIFGSLTIKDTDETTNGDISLTMGFESQATGSHSVAIGEYATAENHGSVAIGRNVRSLGEGSFSMGYESEASGTYSVAMGVFANATNTTGIAIGEYTTAGGHGSVAIGTHVKSMADGSFSIGDLSTYSEETFSTANQFNARFANGYNLYTDSEASIGVTLGANGNSWSSISDSTKKENFSSVDGEGVLNKISGFNLSSWNYKGQDPSLYRHYGPMAQDFYAAFGHDGIGTIGNDTTIAASDFDGINFIAIQALEQRTSDLKAENKHLQSQVDRLHAELERLKTLILELDCSTQGGTGEKKVRTAGHISTGNNHR